VRFRRPRASIPSLLALGATFAGLVGIASALTPELADRSDLVRGVLPPGVPEAARVLALSLGLGLVWLSGSLARRKRRAWQLAVAVVAVSAVVHLAKGLDFEEASVHLLLLAALVRYRRAFVAPGDPETIRPFVRMLVALAAVGVFAALRVSDRMAFSELIEEGLGLLALAFAARALYLWLRPLALRVRQTAPERRLAEQLVHEHGRDSLAFFSLRRDKSYFFSASGSAFLAYRVVSGCALVAGDPIGPAEELDDLLGRFRGFAQARGWRVAILGASGGLLPLYRRRGFHSIYLGDEAVVRPAEFSLEGRAIRKVRQSVHRVRRAGYYIRFVRPGAVTPELRAELERVSHEWRGHWPERGFTMAMDALFAHDEGMLAIAEDAGGAVGGFLQLVPSPASGGYSLAAMRRGKATPNGLMESLVVETIEWARRHGASELSLNFSVFGELLRGCDGTPLWRRAARFGLRRLDRFFQLERLLSFNRKFQPEWRPRYICVERVLDFPVIGLAYLRVESLLTPPGPWAATRDLTAA
jgi:lysyl-tRNA synthetase, class II